MSKWLIPLLIGYSGGAAIYGHRGGVMAAIATSGIIAGSDIPMFLGAMIMGPLGGCIIKKFDDAIRDSIPGGFEMLVNNFSLGILGGILAMIAYAVVGPVVGGLLLEHFEWPSLFWINIVIVLPVAGISSFLVPESRSNKLGRFDAVGMCLAIAALGLFVGSIIEGPQLGWTTLPVLGGLATSILLAGAFMAWEKRVDSPMLDLSLFRASNVATCSSAIGLAFFSLFGFTFTITIYFQAVRGYSALQAGLAILPFAVVMGACSPLAPVLARRFGTGRCVPFGIALMGIGFWIVSFADATNSYWAVMVPAMIFMAMGLAFAQGPATDIILSAAPSDEIGVASGVNDSIREIGGTIGVAVLGSILTHVYRDQMSTVTSTSPSLSAAGDSIMAAQQIVATLPEGSQQTTLRATASDAFLSALHINCLILTGIMLMASILIAFRFVHNARH